MNSDFTPSAKKKKYLISLKTIAKVISNRKAMLMLINEKSTKGNKDKSKSAYRAEINYYKQKKDAAIHDTL